MCLVTVVVVVLTAACVSVVVRYTVYESVVFVIIYFHRRQLVENIESVHTVCTSTSIRHWCWGAKIWGAG